MFAYRISHAVDVRGYLTDTSTLLRYLLLAGRSLIKLSSRSRCEACIIGRIRL